MLGSVLQEVKGLGEGSDKGVYSRRSYVCNILNASSSEIEGFFNLLFSHFVVLYPLDAPETRSRLEALL